ncbi:MAG TPA: shikimate dehydrogenase, partial [Thermodesulfovibrionales bacterium]|nr:shikimate dehydrogenase [Thermodesulfovibrionales bacterium]
MQNISGKTQITGIFGYPIEHTLSPAMQNAAFEATSLDYRYVPFLVHPDALQNAVNAIRALNLRGVNITVPHKEKVVGFLDDVHGEARFIGAVNTIVNSDGNLIGFNTDGRGFMKSLAEAGIPTRDKDILIVGAGGAARAVGYYLCKEAHSLTISARTHEKAETLARDLRKIRDVVQASRTLPEIEEFHVIVNATPLGLKHADPLPFQTMGLHKGQVVYDLIYRDTPLLQDSRAKGCSVLNGAGMLLWQGALAFELWTGKEPPVEAMR